MSAPPTLGTQANQGCETNRTVFNVLRPHLRQALENAMVVTQMQDQLRAMNQVMEEGQQAFISVAGNGRIRFITPYAQRLLKQYGLQMCPDSNGVPTRLRDWLTHCQRQLNCSDDVPPESQPLMHIYLKFGVENRTAAAAVATDAV